MKTDCTLLATLPSLNNMEKVRAVFYTPEIAGVRLNSGVQTPYDADTAVAMLSELARQTGKTLWVDLKGRQLRILKWADPLYSCIELNPRVRFTPPAYIVFRNGDRSRVTHVLDGNRVFVDPLPPEALGAGQSVTLLADGLRIEGYLTPRDVEYLEACRKYGVYDIMASFVEEERDLNAIRGALPGARVISKIESEKGWAFAMESGLTGLMAARDDLYQQCGRDCRILSMLRRIAERDPEAICASKVFLSLEKHKTPELSDYSDLELMYSFGFRRFMLCDNVSNYAFEPAIRAWNSFVNA